MDIEAIRRGAETPVQAGPADLEEVARTLADAFAVDPHFDWFMRDDAKRDAARLTLFRGIIGRLTYPDGRIDRPAGGGAAAVWLPSSSLGGHTPLLQELRTLPIVLQFTGLARFGRLLAIREDMEKHHPLDRPHQYLNFLGVAPRAQGRGVGSSLLRAPMRGSTPRTCQPIWRPGPPETSPSTSATASR
ncbi:MAG: hypothetical protein ACHP84_04890 [Caulobacterales bacterium]